MTAILVLIALVALGAFFAYYLHLRPAEEVVSDPHEVFSPPEVPIDPAERPDL